MNIFINSYFRYATNPTNATNATDATKATPRSEQGDMPEEKPPGEEPGDDTKSVLEEGDGVSHKDEDTSK